jgi:hypothetical protein
MTILYLGYIKENLYKYHENDYTNRLIGVFTDKNKCLEEFYKFFTELYQQYKDIDVYQADEEIQYIEESRGNSLNTKDFNRIHHLKRGIMAKPYFNKKEFFENYIYCELIKFHIEEIKKDEFGCYKDIIPTSYKLKI